MRHTRKFFPIYAQIGSKKEFLPTRYCPSKLHLYPIHWITNPRQAIFFRSVRITHSHFYKAVFFNFAFHAKFNGFLTAATVSVFASQSWTTIFRFVYYGCITTFKKRSIGPFALRSAISMTRWDNNSFNCSSVALLMPKSGGRTCISSHLIASFCTINA